VTIQVLPPEVADAIAAGEVVERPASVAKELVENSLDAGARRISVEIRGAGRSLIRVADDGAGIAAEELPLAFLRHATSKLRTVDDLAAIASLGFRGEALASIAAVADVECKSSRARVHVRGGRLVAQGVAPDAGTVVEVRDLFANTPARLKFLKSEATESAACARVVAAYALLYPGVRFQLRVESRNAFATPGDGDLRRALAAVHGAGVATEMIEARHHVDGQPSVRGMVSQPRMSRGNRDGILVAVNGRPVSSRPLAYALEECYAGSLERGRYPLAVHEIIVEPAQVDVNVHPTKREVRFREEGVVFAAVQRAVRAALSGAAAHRLSAPSAAPAAHAAIPPPEVHSPAPALGPVAAEPPRAGLLRPIGQVADGYLVAEGPDGVVLVDQHAAHERILYNRFLARLSDGSGASQPLLIPITLELGPRELAVASDHAHDLEALGFELEEFGPRSLRVVSAPAETPPGRVAAAVEELDTALGDLRGGDAKRIAAATLACHSAVRFGDRLEGPEQRFLLEELERAEDAVTCPHGRPTRLVVEWQELKRRFRRNY
jgi:DNA mismatch repair protein MutL